MTIASLTDLHGVLGTGVTPTVFATVSITSNAIFFADTNAGLRSYDLNVANPWGSPPTLGAALNAPPLVTSNLVYASPGAADGSIHGFLRTDGSTTSPAFSFQPNAVKKSISAVAFGKETNPVIYLTDSGNELVAMTSDLLGGGALAAGWTVAFKGTLVNGTDVSFTGFTSELAMGSDGTLYFGADNAKVYAIMTDSGGTFAPSNTSWPRVGFDNCNSGNSSYTSCP